MPKLSDIQIRDPFILRENDVLYLYGSTDKNIWQAPAQGFEVYRSTSGFESFEGPFPAFTPTEDFWSEQNFWAPEVYSYAGSYYMFATFKPKNGRRGTAVLKSHSPLGPFVPWSDGPLTPSEWECLDGTLYIENGKPWMVFCHEWQQVQDGEICAIQLSDDLKSTTDAPVLLFCASEAKWSKPLPKREGENYVTDGPYMYRAKNDDLLMLWSSFGETGNYCIGYAKSSDGTLLGKWEQRDEPLYQGDGGHGMLFTDIKGKLYLSIHTPNDTPNERPLFIQLNESEGELFPTDNIVR